MHVCIIKYYDTKEAYELFKSMLGRVNKEIISFLFNGQLPSKDPSEIREDRKVRRQQKLNISKEEAKSSSRACNGFNSPITLCRIDSSTQRGGAKF